MRAISSGRGRSSFYQQWVLSVAGGWRHFASTSSESAGGGQAAAQVGVADFSLASKYESSKEGRVYITGLQALVKIPLLVRDRDEERGMKTAGFISGYRGSPLGAYDQNLWIAHQYLSKAGIVFTPGINEEIAATSVWGSQQAAASPGAKFDGVFGIWYGKGPGLDRSNDAMKHANMAGSSRLGGVLCLAGDDHAAKSSTLPHQSELNLRDMNIPCLYPSSVAEMISYGVLGIEMSRFSGTWVGMKVTGETVDSSCTMDLSEISRAVVTPGGFDMPPGGLNLRVPDHWDAQEVRMYRHKLRAILAFARANSINGHVMGAPLGCAKLGIIAAGKSYRDVLQCLGDMGLRQEELLQLGVSVYKVGLVWPLEPEGILEFTQGMREVLVVEEKRSFIETQVREMLYDRENRPRVVGKASPGEPLDSLLKQEGELSLKEVANAIRLSLERTCGIKAGGGMASDSDLMSSAKDLPVKRLPYFCAGCPHNTGTSIVEGAHAIGGIGCHTLGMFMGDRGAQIFTQMGGEGSNWIGQAPFVETPHAFANVGDGTYVHSALLSIRACVAADCNMTFKILYNGAVAMTGGQTNDTKAFSTPGAIARQLEAEGVKEVVIVTDDMERYAGGTSSGVPTRFKVQHRRDFNQVQTRLQGVTGTTAIIYDQACATEKRRQRKRGTIPQAPERVFIHPGVCEGCGDCGKKSNCVAVMPLATPLGRKRTVDQTQCTQDTQCITGFCPSFVTVSGGTRRKSSLPVALRDHPLPDVPTHGRGGGDVLVCGVGGTGVVTVAAVLGMAGHIEGLDVNVLDQIGLSQKGGPVASHVRVSMRGHGAWKSARIGEGKATSMLACDMVTALLPQHLACVGKGVTRVVANLCVAMPGSFARAPDMQVPVQDMVALLTRAAGNDLVHRIDFTALAREVLGDSVLANVVLLGYALQAGALPVGEQAVRKSIQTIGIAVEENLDALTLGRHACADPVRVLEHMRHVSGQLQAEQTLDEDCMLLSNKLEQYQDSSYARRFMDFVDKVKSAEEALVGKQDPKVLARAAARAYYKLLAYKDEYEVARLHCDGTVEKEAGKILEGDLCMTYHLAPPFLSFKDPATGHPLKIRVPAWVAKPAFRTLASAKSLRGSWLDVFGYTEERCRERRAIQEYEDLAYTIVAEGALSNANYRYALELLEEPLSVRGFGHVKEAAGRAAKERRLELVARFQNPPSPSNITTVFGSHKLQEEQRQ